MIMLRSAWDKATQQFLKSDEAIRQQNDKLESYMIKSTTETKHLAERVTTIEEILNSTTGAKLPATSQATPAPPVKSNRWSAHAQQLRDQVRATYEKVIKEFPNSAEVVDAYLGLAEMAEEDEDWPSAAKWYQRLLTDFSKAPAAPDAQFRLGHALAAQKKFGEARDVYTNMADKYPRHDRAPYALLAAADCSAELNDLVRAYREYLNIERSKTGTSFANLARQKEAEIRMKEKRYPEAIEILKHAVAEAQGKLLAELEVQLGEAQLGAGLYAEARQTLTGAIAKADDDTLGWQSRWLRARALEEDKDPYELDAARAYASLADKYAQNPKAVEARLRAADSYLAAECPGHAADQAELAMQSLQNEPAERKAQYEPKALFTLAHAEQLDHKSDKAAEHLKELRTRYPDNDLVVDADLEEANALVRSAAKAPVQNPAPGVVLPVANSHKDIELQRINEAIAVLLNSVRSHAASPHIAPVQKRLAELQERSKDASRGIGIYLELLGASKLAADRAVYKFRQGVVYQQVGSGKEARAIFSALIDNVNAPVAVAALARYQLAVLDEHDGRLAEAVAGYEKFTADCAGVAVSTLNLSGLAEDARWSASKLRWLMGQPDKIPGLIAPTEKAKPSL